MYANGVERMGRKGAPRRITTTTRRGKSSASGRLHTLEMKRARALKGGQR